MPARRKPLAMLLEDTAWARIRDTVNSFRVAVLATIAFLAALMVIVACVVAIFDVSDKAMNVVSIVLTALPTMVTALIVYLKIEGVGEEVKSGNVQAASAAAIAASAARAAVKKGQEIHDDLLNGPMKEAIKRAIQETEDDPAIQALRIELAAKGVSKDRHDKLNREAGPDARAQMEARIRRREGQDS
jgi:hypothetical protein